MITNNLLQITIILFHCIILYIKFTRKTDLKNYIDWYEAFLQGVLIFLFIRELSIADLSFKKWYWFMMDILLALYFYLKITKK